MVHVDSWSLERFVFEFTLCLLEWVSSCVFQLFVAELSPCVACSISRLGFECIITSIFWNVADFFFIDSGKELLRIIFILIIVVFFLLPIYLSFKLRFYFFQRFNLFLNFLLWSNRFSWLLIFKLKFFFWVKIRGIHWPFNFLNFFLFLNFLLLFFRLWNLFWLTMLFRWLLLLSLLWLLILLRNINFNLLLLDWLLIIVIQVLQSLGLLKLTCHPSLCWGRIINWNRWYFWWFGLGRFRVNQRRLSWRYRFS